MAGMTDNPRPLKIVLLAPFGIRPKGTVLARMVPLAAALQALGNEVVIIAPPYTNPEDSGKVERVHGVRLVNVSLPKGGKLLGAPVLAWRMFRAALAERPDLVHLFKPKGYGGLAAMLMIALRSIGMRLPPVLVDTDDWEGKGGMNDLHPYSGAERAVFAFQESWLLPHAEAVTVASRALESMASELRRGGRRLLYLPNCVEDGPLGDSAGIREKLGIPPGSPIVLLYTRFFEFSQEKLHAVFSEIHRLVPAAHFLVVGKGRRGEESLLKDAADRQGFASVLHLAGWVEPAELPSYFAAADLAIYPFAENLVNRCKCPAKLTELLRAGVPVVADRVGQVAEYIRDAETGILCGPDDWQEMAARTVELLNDPEKRGLLGATGRCYLLEHFSWHVFASKLQQFYHESLSDFQKP
jgi:glycosyltransferase involved in cell wall biosynthesis